MKRIGKIKRVATLGLIFLLYINSFATSIVNNDGSAFITKAEFDALKSSFQSQIDSYNQGIDSKIDGAIASYLSNLDITEDVIDKIAYLNRQSGNNFRFINTTLNPGKPTITTDLQVDVNFDIYKITPVVYDRVRAQNNMLPGIYYDVCATMTYLNIHDDGSDLFTSVGSGKQATLPTTWTRKNAVGLTSVAAQDEFISKNESEHVRAGDGSVWEYYLKPNGKRKLTSFNSNYFPMQIVVGNWHYYKLYWVKNSTSTYTNNVLINYIGKSTGADIGATKTVDIDRKESWGQYSGGTSVSKNTKSESTWWNMELKKMQSKDPTDWEIFQLSGNTDSEIYCINQNKDLTVGSRTTKAMTVKYNERYCDPSGPSTRDVNVGTMNVRYYPVSYTPEIFKVNTFINDILTGVNGEDTYLGGGTVLCQVPKASKVKFTLDLQYEDPSGTPANGDIYVYIGDKQFKDGVFVTGAIKHVDGESVSVTTATDGGKKSWTFDCIENEKVWINLIPSVNGSLAYIKSATYEYVS